MFVVARRVGQSFLLDDEYELKVLDVRGKIARIGVAHRSRPVVIVRAELLQETELLPKEVGTSTVQGTLGEDSRER